LRESDKQKLKIYNDIFEVDFKNSKNEDGDFLYLNPICTEGTNMRNEGDLSPDLFLSKL
jgi:hypothetical protein